MSVKWDRAETDPVAEPALTLHESKTAATDDVHGSKTYADAQVASEATARTSADATEAAAREAHEAATTDVHGIPDTSVLVVTTDPRLSDQRDPTDGSVTDAKVAVGAAIAYAKLDLAGSVVLSDLAFDPATQTELDAESAARVAQAGTLVALAPGSSVRNVIQPSGDFKALIVKAAVGQTQNPFEVQDSLGNPKVQFTSGW